MKQSHYSYSAGQKKFISLVFSLVGFSYALAGFLAIFFPEFSLDYIGRFPPFNRHYIGDTGVFLFAVGAGIFYIRDAPWEHQAMIGVGLLSTQAHGLNHLYDAILHRPELFHWLTDVLPNLAASIFYLLAFLQIKSGSRA